MSKKRAKKNIPPKPEPQRKRVNPASGPPAGSWPVRPATVTDQDPFLRKLFLGLTLGFLFITVLLALNSGMNGDDEFQNDYSTKLVDYYATMGADTSALYIEKGKMHYYGGFFDLLSGVVNRALGYDEFDWAYHKVRHFFNAVFGVLAMFFVGLIAREIAGWRAAILALVLIFFSPRFLGHSLMNPKDIPFAAGFAIATYYMIKVLRLMPRPRWQDALGLALGMGLAIATRAGGLLLMAYFFLFCAMDFVIKYGLGRIFKELQTVLYYAAYAIGVSLAAYILAILTWPAALADPLHHPLEALTEFSKLGVRIRVLFAGENLLSDDTPWYYASLWIIKTIPLYALIGFFGSLALLPRLLKRYQPLPIILVYFATVFPLAYIIYKDSILHDGWRHLIFVYPSLVVAATLFWLAAERLLEKNKTGTYLLYGILGLMILEPAIFIVRNYEYPYVYFNPIGGGIKGAFGNYETDYWGVGVKEAIDWLEEEGRISPEMQDTLYIGTTFYYNVDRLTRERYNGKVRARYVRFNRRYTEEWDYGVFPSRFVRGAHLRSGNWPEQSKLVHTIAANGVPLVEILQETNKHAYKGEVAATQQNWPVALAEFQAELQDHPENELAWLGLANAQLNMGNTAEAIQSAQQALTVAPDTENALYFLGLAYLRNGNSNEAEAAFRRAIEVNDEYYVAHYYLALVLQAKQQYTQALEYALEAIRINPRFKQGYELAGTLYEQQGDPTNAARYRQAAQQL